MEAVVEVDLQNISEQLELPELDNQSDDQVAKKLEAAENKCRKVMKKLTPEQCLEEIPELKQHLSAFAQFISTIISEHAKIVAQFRTKFAQEQDSEISQGVQAFLARVYTRCDLLTATYKQVAARYAQLTAVEDEFKLNTEEQRSMRLEIVAVYCAAGESKKKEPKRRKNMQTNLDKLRTAAKKFLESKGRPKKQEDPGNGNPRPKKRQRAD